ncbi:hypothetical protein [Pseudomonas sp. A6]|uniref:hypothetical protein n=1 Tax=Pseudomonas sp. A6 TaxID=410021 RepID=UPI004025161D
MTNWHVVSGLDPANPSACSIANPPPTILKVSLINKSNKLTELMLPLYSEDMSPCWYEHPLGYKVDVAIYELPLGLQDHFHFVDIHSAASGTEITEAVAKDVYILGYPFSKEEMKSVFGDEAPYYLPTWKKGTIASEPKVRLGGHVLLIDSLSRAGMSGAPIVLSEDSDMMKSADEHNKAIFAAMNAGDSSALLELDMTKLEHEKEKKFKLLGVYSGTIGSTKLAEISLGKCWHVDILREAVEDHKAGVMPCHNPMMNEFYRGFLSEICSGELITRDESGKEVSRKKIR